jgi:hypothetical protein
VIVAGLRPIKAALHEVEPWLEEREAAGLARLVRAIREARPGAGIVMGAGQPAPGP